MADKLTYKGGARVVGNSGTAKLVLPAGGGDFHRVPKWWGKKGTVSYVEAAIFKVPLDNGAAVRLILPDVKAHLTVEIRHDGAGNFTFPIEGHLERAAVTATDSLAVLVEYQFAKISGGAVLKRSISPLPTPPEQSVAFQQSTSISGNATVGSVLTATAATYTGGKGTVTTNLIFQVSDTGAGGWSFLAGNPGTASGATATYTVTGASDGKYIRASYQVVDDESTHTSNSNSTAAITSTFATRQASAEYSYTVTVVNTGTAESPVNVYALNGTNQLAVSMSANETAAFDFSGVAGAHPLGIFTDSTKTTPVTAGVETGGTGNAILLFKPASNGTFSYQCINHAAMGGDITVS